MRNALAGLTRFDWAKLSLYGVAVCGALSVALLNTVLKPWGWDDAHIAALSAKIGSVTAVFGLIGVIANTFKNPSSPKGTYRVLSTSPAPDAGSLTTHAELAGPQPPAADAPQNGSPT